MPARMHHRRAPSAPMRHNFSPGTKPLSACTVLVKTVQRGFVDLHVHLLPGVDDGPRDLDATLELAGLEVADGIVTATATPHVASVDVAEIPERVEEVNAALRAAGIPLVVVGGGELAARGTERLSAAELETIAHGPPGGG